jgi:diguanylate cyclase (GGDEF)-like protein
MMQKLLTIDDDEATHALVDLYLSGRHRVFLSAYDGNSGLTVARERLPNLILLDTNLPGIRGPEVCRRLKEDPDTRGIPVIFLSADARTENKVDALQAGAVDYVTKPFEPAELVARVQSALRTKQAADAADARATVDETTGLFNRSYLERRIEADLAAARRSNRSLACCLVSVDPTNGPSSRPGTKAFDELIQVTSGAIVASLRREDVVCRFGPKTFGILAFVANGRTASELAERTLAAVVSAGVHCREVPANIICCIGLASSRFSFGRELLREAERVLWDARASGKDCIRFGREFVQLGAAGADTLANCQLQN